MTEPWPLLRYQARWVREAAPLAVCRKARRIGISWAEAYNSVLAAADGSGNSYYQSYSLDMTRGFMSDCADWCADLGKAASEIIEDEVLVDEKSVTRFRIEFPGGKIIQALPSNPRSMRSKGKPGDRYILDEAAFCNDLAELLKAAMAVTTWGGILRIISTPNGETNPFELLCDRIRDGKRPRSALHEYTLDDAIADGLVERIFQVAGREWFEGARKTWRAERYAEYDHQEDADEELGCKAKSGGGTYLRWDWLTRARHLDAGLPALYGGGSVFIGEDVARRRDLWCASAIERVSDVFWLREIETGSDISFAAQDAHIDRFFKTYRVAHLCLDQTGMGERVKEEREERHGGDRVTGVLMTPGKRYDVAKALKRLFEDNLIRIPFNDDLLDDLRSIKRSDRSGEGGAVKLVHDGTGDGHADRFWSLALGAYAAEIAPTMQYEYYTGPTSDLYADEFDEDDFRRGSLHGWPGDGGGRERTWFQR